VDRLDRGASAYAWTEPIIKFSNPGEEMPFDSRYINPDNCYESQTR